MNPPDHSSPWTTRPIDNVFIERLWRSVKYEYIGYRPPVDVRELYQGLNEWFIDYNTDRRHPALNDVFLETVYEFYKPKAPEAARTNLASNSSPTSGEGFR